MKIVRNLIFIIIILSVLALGILSEMDSGSYVRLFKDDGSAKSLNKKNPSN